MTTIQTSDFNPWEGIRNVSSSSYYASKRVDEASRKDIISDFLVAALGINQHVGERRRSVPDVGTLGKKPQYFANLPVYFGYFAFVVFDIDRRIIGLVVNQQEWTIVLAIVFKPESDFSQGVGVLLDHEDKRLLDMAGGHSTHGVFGGFVEIADS